MNVVKGEPDNEHNKRSIIGYILIFIAVLSAWGLCWWLVTINIPQNSDGTWSNRGQFGDMFGAVNALFSGCAFAGIIITILLQREELSLQRKELRDTRAEFAQQNKTLKLQRFETTFFNLLTLHNDLTAKLKYSNAKLEGREVFQHLISAEFDPHFFGKNFEQLTHSELAAMTKQYKEKVFPAIKFYVQHYLSSLESLYNFITELEIDDERQKYFKILKGYITNNELEFLYLHVNFSDEVIKQNQALRLMAHQLKLFEGINGIENRYAVGITFISV